jgi:MFS family permease
MSSPPWVFAVIVSMANAWHADRTQEKVGPLPLDVKQARKLIPQFWHIVGPICMGLVGFVISISTEVVAARYVALFLQAGSYAGFIVFYSLLSSSFPRPPAKRAVAIAMVNAFSQLGNIAGSYVWQMPENGFRKSYGIVIAMFGVTIAGCFWFRQILIGLNKKIEAAEQAATAQGPEDSHKHDQIHVEGDHEISGLQRGFRYLV